MEYLIRNNKLAVHQSGNRKLHSKQLCCTLGISYSRLWIARKSPSWSYSISQGALDWFQSYLSKRQQCVLLDTCLSYNEHITKTASNCLFKLQQIRRIKHLLDRKTLFSFINSFIFSKLQYCSTVWSNTSNSNIDKSQKVQNFAGRIILGKRKYDHISDGLRSLKWLPIREKLILNDATLMHKCINKPVPDYLADIFKLRSQVHNRQT